MEMTVLQRDDQITHIALSGRLDATAAEQLEGRFGEEVAGRHQPAIIDMSQIEFMASRGIGMLFANSKKLKKDGHKLIILSPQGMVDAVLKTSKMDKVMPIAYDLSQAVVMAGGVAAPAQPAAELEFAEPLPDDAPREEVSATAAEAAEPPDETPEGILVTADAAAAAPRRPDGGELRLSIQNNMSEFERLNAELADFLAANQIRGRAEYAANLVLEELVMNVIRYAYVDDDPHFIDIHLRVEGEQMILTMVDDGRPFDPRESPALNLHDEDREVGGLGLLLVLDMVDVLRYQRIDETNRVEARIHLFAEERTTA